MNTANDPAVPTAGGQGTAQTDESHSKGDLVLFIHGTFAYDEHDVAATDNKSRWWQRDSDFYDALKKNCPSYRIVPGGVPESMASPPWWCFWKRGAKSTDGSTIDPEMVFHWGGANSESARRRAGERLFEHLQSVDEICERDGCKFHMIAHSHGGGVVWDALRLAYRDHAKRGEEEKPLPRLSTWITVATPFMHYGADWWRLVWFAIALASFLVVSIFQASWWWDFWNQHGLESEASAFIKYAWFLVTHIAALMLFLLIWRATWSIWRWSQSGHANTAVPNDERRQAGFDLLSVLGATVLAGIAVSLLAWLAGEERCAKYFSEATQWDVLGASLWTIAILAATILVVVGIVAGVCRWWAERSRSRSAKHVWKAFCDRHRALPEGYEKGDEAVNGLRAIRYMPQVEILPRLPAPGSDRFTKHTRRSKHPEWERQRQHFWPWAMEYVLLPVTVISDWVFGPFYNEIFAPLVDNFVLTRLWRSAHGADLAGSEIVDVTTIPVRRDRCVPPAEASKADTTAYDKTVEKVLQENAGLLHRVRQLLGGNFSEGVEIRNFFKTVMGDPSQSQFSLLHTAYFGVDKVREVIAERLNDPMLSAVEPTDSAPNAQGSSSGKGGLDCKECRSPQLQFLAAVLQFIVKTAILVTPAVLLWFAGEFLFYEWSKANLVRWAMEEQPIETIMDKFELVPAQTKLRRPLLEYLASLPPALVESRNVFRASRFDARLLRLCEVDYAVQVALRGKPDDGLRVFERLVAKPDDSEPDDQFTDLVNKYLAAALISLCCHPTLSKSGQLSAMQSLRDQAVGRYPCVDLSELATNLATDLNTARTSPILDQFGDAFKCSRYRRCWQQINSIADTEDRLKVATIILVGKDLAPASASNSD